MRLFEKTTSKEPSANIFAARASPATTVKRFCTAFGHRFISSGMLSRVILKGMSIKSQISGVPPKSITLPPDGRCMRRRNAFIRRRRHAVRITSFTVFIGPHDLASRLTESEGGAPRKVTSQGHLPHQQQRTLHLLSNRAMRQARSRAPDRTEPGACHGLSANLLGPRPFPDFAGALESHVSDGRVLPADVHVSIRVDVEVTHPNSTRCKTRFQPTSQEMLRKRAQLF